MKRVLSAIVVLLLVVSMLAGCGKSEPVDAASITPDTVVATIGNQDIYVYEMDYLMFMGATKEQALDELKNFKAMYQKAQDEKITLDDADLKQLADQKATMTEQYGGTEATNAIFKQYGLTAEQYDKINEMSALVSKFSGKLEELGFLVPANDADAKEFYESHYLRAKHILFSTQDSATGQALDDDAKAEKKKLAQETLDKINAGEDFDSFMSLSEDPGAAQNPDGYLFLNTDEYREDEAMMSSLSQMGSVMVEAFENGTKELVVGEVSPELVESNFGYHIIKRLDINENDSLFSGVSDQIKSILDNINYMNLTKEWENGYKFKSNDGVLASLDDHFKLAKDEAKKYEEQAQQAMQAAQNAMIQQQQASQGEADADADGAAADEEETQTDEKKDE